MRLPTAMNIVVFWSVTLNSGKKLQTFKKQAATSFFRVDGEDGGSRFLQDVSYFPPDYAMSHERIK
jgi:hypothetical protein